jgi:hypothetical protein
VGQAFAASTCFFNNNCDQRRRQKTGISTDASVIMTHVAAAPRSIAHAVSARYLRFASTSALVCFAYCRSHNRLLRLGGKHKLERASIAFHWPVKNPIITLTRQLHLLCFVVRDLLDSFECQLEASPTRPKQNLTRTMPPRALVQSPNGLAARRRNLNRHAMRLAPCDSPTPYL